MMMMMTMMWLLCWQNDGALERQWEAACSTLRERTRYLHSTTHHLFTRVQTEFGGRPWRSGQARNAAGSGGITHIGVRPGPGLCRRNPLSYHLSADSGWRRIGRPWRDNRPGLYNVDIIHCQNFLCIPHLFCVLQSAVFTLSATRKDACNSFGCCLSVCLYVCMSAWMSYDNFRKP